MKLIKLTFLTAICILVLLGCVSCSDVNNFETTDAEYVVNNQVENEVDSSTVGESEKNEIDSSEVDETKENIENIFRTPNVGVQAVYNEENNIVFEGVEYYYFDVLYNLLMGDESAIGDDAVTSVFVDIKKQAIYEAVVDNDGIYVIGVSLFD